MRAIGSTRENLEHAATGEVLEIDVVLPRMIREAEEEGRADAAASFRLALERERHHRDMFRGALKDFDATPRVAPVLPAAPARPAVTPEPIAPGHSSGGGATLTPGRACPSPRRAGDRVQAHRAPRLDPRGRLRRSGRSGVDLRGGRRPGRGRRRAPGGAARRAGLGGGRRAVHVDRHVPGRARPAPAVRARARSRASRDPRASGRGDGRADRRPGRARHAARRRLRGGPPDRPLSRADAEHALHLRAGPGAAAARHARFATRSSWPGRSAAPR